MHGSALFVLDIKQRNVYDIQAVSMGKFWRPVFCSSDSQSRSSNPTLINDVVICQFHIFVKYLMCKMKCEFAAIA